MKSSDRSLEKQIASYALAGGVSLLALPGAAEASIVYSGVLDIPLNLSGTPAIPINFDGDSDLELIFTGLPSAGNSTSAFSFASAPGIQFLQGAGSFQVDLGGGTLASKQLAEVLPGGTVIGPTAPGASTWSTAGTPSSPPTKGGLQDYGDPSLAPILNAWAGESRKFIGLNITLTSEATYDSGGSVTAYGPSYYTWVRISVPSTFGAGFVLHDWGYENQAGVSIRAGAGALGGTVPEPGTLQVVALGSAGLIAWRRRRLQADFSAADA